MSALRYSIHLGMFEMARLLIDAGANLNEDVYYMPCPKDFWMRVHVSIHEIGRLFDTDRVLGDKIHREKKSATTTTNEQHVTKDSRSKSKPKLSDFAMRFLVSFAAAIVPIV